MPTLVFRLMVLINQPVVSHSHLNKLNSLQLPRAVVLVSPSMLPSTLHLLVAKSQSKSVQLTGLPKNHQRISSFNQEVQTVQVTSTLLQLGLAKISSFCIIFTPCCMGRMLSHPAFSKEREDQEKEKQNKTLIIIVLLRFLVLVLRDL